MKYTDEQLQQLCEFIKYHRNELFVDERFIGVLSNELFKIRLDKEDRVNEDLMCGLITYADLKCALNRVSRSLCWYEYQVREIKRERVICNCCKYCERSKF